MVFLERLGFVLFLAGVCWSMLDLALGNSFTRNYEGVPFGWGLQELLSGLRSMPSLVRAERSRVSCCDPFNSGLKFKSFLPPHCLPILAMVRSTAINPVDRMVISYALSIVNRLWKAFVLSEKDTLISSNTAAVD